MQYNSPILTRYSIETVRSIISLFGFNSSKTFTLTSSLEEVYFRRLSPGQFFTPSSNSYAQTNHLNRYTLHCKLNPIRFVLQRYACLIGPSGLPCESRVLDAQWSKHRVGSALSSFRLEKPQQDSQRYHRPLTLTARQYYPRGNNLRCCHGRSRQRHVHHLNANPVLV